MLTKFLNVLFGMSNRVFYLIGFFIFSMALALYFLLGKQASDALIEQMLHREQLATRSGGKTIEIFFNLFGRSLRGLASRDTIINFSEAGKEDIIEYAKRWEGTPVVGIAYADATGTVRVTGDGDLDIASNVSDRAYYRWAQTAQKGEVYISAPVVSKLGHTKGEIVIPVATPVISENGNFKGALVAVILVSELQKEFIYPIKVTDQTLVYLISSDGTILYSDTSADIGKNLLGELRGHPFLGSDILLEKFTGILASGQEGKLDIVYPVNLETYQLKRMLAAYSPVRVDDNLFYVGIATPVSEALIYVMPFYFKNVAIAGLFLLAFALIAIRFAKSVGYHEALEHKK